MPNACFWPSIFIKYVVFWKSFVEKNLENHFWNLPGLVTTNCRNKSLTKVPIDPHTEPPRTHTPRTSSEGVGQEKFCRKIWLKHGQLHCPTANNAETTCYSSKLAKKWRYHRQTEYGDVSNSLQKKGSSPSKNLKYFTHVFDCLIWQPPWQIIPEGSSWAYGSKAISW